MLKNLKLWLEGHPHFNVDPKWGSLAIEWVRQTGIKVTGQLFQGLVSFALQGALKPDMYHRILLGNSSEHDSNSSL